MPRRGSPDRAKPRALRVTQVRSTIGHIERNRATVRALGLRRIGDSVVVPDNDATRGMVRQVRFLVTVDELPGDKPEEPAAGSKRLPAKPSPGNGGAGKEEA